MKRLFFLSFILFPFAAMAQTANDYDCPRPKYDCTQKNSVLYLDELYVLAEINVYPKCKWIKDYSIQRDTTKTNKFRIHKFKIQRKYYVMERHFSYHIKTGKDTIVGQIDNETRCFEWNNLSGYLMDNIRYPDSLIRQLRTGTNDLKFSIDADYNIKDVELIVVKGNDFAQEILPVLQSIPKTLILPIQCDAKYSMRINFRIRASESDQCCIISPLGHDDIIIFWK